MNQNIAILRSAALAGLCISIGCVVNLRVGGVAGAALFAFGLLAVVHYKLKLYTGTAGFIRAKGDWTMLTLVLVGNIIACGLTAWAISYAQPDVLQADHVIDCTVATGQRTSCLFSVSYWLWLYHDNRCTVWQRRKISPPTLWCPRIHSLWLYTLYCRCLLFLNSTRAVQHATAHHLSC